MEVNKKIVKLFHINSHRFPCTDKSHIDFLSIFRHSSQILLYKCFGKK